ncbi:AAA family ATPase [Photobacterium phosphoreum]|uniref:AAA family ATPase n=2 Tax=Photobacterium phosphoreum TaxID=659 RepID=A0AAW4ZU19_PHOPO|nr:ParA family protein [Photobacterium phosphoreum]MCD9492650.1 AAA family ATPase [Photobacterium phosphoreum]MCF2191785.1 AAA family ATPase [Photobacterium phosphoreum]MCF2303481.1 AAA family ATPase [Photobacterium phosphoreum]
MEPMFLCLMASKGGVGKSTICKQLARELHRIGRTVAALDYDPQKHLDRFVDANPAMFKAEYAEYVVVDTQGVHSKKNIEIINAMLTKNALIIVPFRPSEDDYIEALTMRDRLKELGALDKAVFVANACYRETDKDVLHYSSLLSDSVRVAKSVLVQRKAYAKEPDRNVINEISRLLNEVVL